MLRDSLATDFSSAILVHPELRIAPTECLSVGRVLGYAVHATRVSTPPPLERTHSTFTLLLATSQWGLFNPLQRSLGYSTAERACLGGSSARLARIESRTCDSTLLKPPFPRSQRESSTEPQTRDSLVQLCLWPKSPSKEMTYISLTTYIQSLPHKRHISNGLYKRYALLDCQLIDKRTRMNFTESSTTKRLYRPQCSRSILLLTTFSYPNLVFRVFDILHRYRSLLHIYTHRRYTVNTHWRSQPVD